MKPIGSGENHRPRRWRILVVGELGCQRPERLVELLALIQTENRSRAVPTNPHAFAVTQVTVATANQVLLNDVERGPEVRHRFSIGSMSGNSCGEGQ